MYGTLKKTLKAYAHVLRETRTLEEKHQTFLQKLLKQLKARGKYAYIKTAFTCETEWPDNNVVELAEVFLRTAGLGEGCEFGEADQVGSGQVEDDVEMGDEAEAK